METIFTDGQLKKFMETMRQKGMTPKRFNELLESGVLADVLDPKAHLDRAAIRRVLKLDICTSEIFLLQVNYSLTLSEMIAAGAYSVVSTQLQFFDVTKEKGLQQFEAQLIGFDRPMYPKVLLTEVDAMDTVNPWKVGKVEHLLAMGDQYPEMQCKNNIVALGSTADVRGVGKYIAYLTTHVSEMAPRGTTPERMLGAIGYNNTAISTKHRFLVVRQISQR